MVNLRADIEHLRSLDNDSLLRSLKRHASSSNRLHALVLAHLAEVDARGAYRHWACDTLATYCVYELRLSEDEAQRRCRAARVARQYPVLFEMLADASIHLTGILQLAPYLTPENHREVLARARYRRKREIERLVAELAPACDVPALVEPLRTMPSRAKRAPSTWAALVAGGEGWVRQLQAGDGPAQAPSAPDAWHEALVTELEAEQKGATSTQGKGEHEARVEEGAIGDADAPASKTSNEGDAPEHTNSHGDASARNDSTVRAGAPARNEAGREYQALQGGATDEHHASAHRVDARDVEAAAPVIHGIPVAPSLAAPVASPLRYRVQFTADQAFVDLLERARDLLWHQLPSAELAEIHRRALEALVEKLMSRKCSLRAETTAPQRPAPSDGVRDRRLHLPLGGAAPARVVHPSSEGAMSEGTDDPSLDATAPARSMHPGPDGTAPARVPHSEGANAAPAPNDSPAGTAPARLPTLDVEPAPAASPSRYIPAAVRRHVWERDGGRCTFTDRRGVRCRAARAIEFHHEHAHALGGPSSAQNITLRCRAHNELAAEGDFGRELMTAMKHRSRAPTTT